MSYSPALGLVLALGCLGLAACNCPGPPRPFFSSDEGIACASCMAGGWASDAVLHGVSVGHRDPYGDANAASATQFLLHDDGRSEEWIVTFAAPSQQCGPNQYRTQTYTVRADGATASGSSCQHLRLFCSVGLPSTPPDSTLVVPAGRQEILKMPGYNLETGTILAQNLWSCDIINGMVVKPQSWRVWGTWREQGAWHEGVVEFDSVGKVTAVRGPCRSGDVSCLRP